MDSNRQADDSGLLPDHREALHARALTDEQILARGYRSISDTKADRELLSQAGIVKAGQRVPGLLLPLRRADGSVWGYQYRPDNPRIGNDGRVIKYESAHRMKVGLDVPPGVDLARLTDPSEPLLITEGVFKADAGAIAGLKIVALIGVWNWLHTNEAGGKAIIPELYELAVNGGRVVLAFDGDVARKFGVQHAAKSLGGWLANRGATVEFLHLPDGDVKTGLDDFLVTGKTADDVMSLVYPHLPTLHDGQADESPRSEPSKPKPEFGSIDGAQVLDDVARWFGRFIRFTHDDDVYLVTLWAVHTHMSIELYSTPRLQVDSITYGSGKTTLLDHLKRLCRSATLLASLPSPALIPRMIEEKPRTFLFDEINRTLNSQNPAVPEVEAIINSGYRDGTTRPVNVPDGDGGWTSREMSIFAPVALSGNSPKLDGDTLSRGVRVMLMPDLEGLVESSYWWLLAAEVTALAKRIADWADSVRDQIAVIPLDEPQGCIGRLWEKWRPLSLVAEAAGGRWPDIARRMAEHDVEETGWARDSDMDSKPRPMILLADLYALWADEDERFLPTEEILRRLKQLNAAYWTKDGDANPYERDLTAKGLRHMISNAAKLTPRPEVFDDITPVQPGRGASRGYYRKLFVPLWRRLGISKEQVSECVAPPSQEPDASDANDAPDATRPSFSSGASDESDASGPSEGETSTHSLDLIEYCLDCGTELTDEEIASSKYRCLECLDTDESGEERLSTNDE